VPLTITCRADGGTVRGAVEDCLCATVMLVPREPRLRIQALLPSADCGAGGRFEFAAVPPGEYYALAVDRAPGMEAVFFGLTLDQALLVDL
jgi:hypothetical protein